VVMLLFTPTGVPLSLRLLISISFALFLAEAVLFMSKRASRRAALPEKQAIYESAAIDDFSWRATVFEFRNETFAESFRALNESVLMEI